MPPERTSVLAYYEVNMLNQIDKLKLAQVIQGLPYTMESPHFCVHYGLRNPRRGRGLGACGVGDVGLIRRYLNALERLYQTMASPPWSRAAPQTDASGKTHVYVYDLDHIVAGGDPFTSVNGEGIPYIALSCRSNEPLTDGAMRRAEAEAVHEATHVFNAAQRPFHRKADFYWWAWLDEAIATFMESQVLPGNHDYFRFLSNWIDRPGLALNDWQAAYHGCLFLDYLSEAVDHRFPNRIWIDATPNERPLQTMDRLASVFGRVFADPLKQDLFANGYAMAAYFLRHPTGGCFGELYSRFGDRAVAESFELYPGFNGCAQESLPHLASHYYRFFVSRHVHRVRFTLRAVPRNGNLYFKAEAAVVQPDLSCGPRLPLNLNQDGNTSNGIELVGELAGLYDLDFNHLVLVVSNCSYKDMDLPWNNPVPSCETYEIQIMAD